MQIFLDSGNPEETNRAIQLIGALDGQTTNPSLVAKQLTGEHTEQEVWNAYRSIAVELRSLLDEQPSISLEVDANEASTAKDLIKQGLAINEWIPNAHIKLPITHAGLEAAEYLVKEGIQVNMTLCFSLEQAYAVHLMAVQGNAQKGQVLVSPFMGRLDDSGVDGIGVVGDIVHLYRTLSSPVLVLAASIRHTDHIEGAQQVGADIATIPFKFFEAEPDLIRSLQQLEQPEVKTTHKKKLPLFEQPNWQSCNLDHPLTKKGLQQFSDDWKALIG